MSAPDTASVRLRLLPFRMPRVHHSLRRPLAICGAGVLVIWIVVAIVAPAIAPDDPTAPSAALLQAPSGAHPFGTDELGRDVLSRVIYGSRVSLPLAALLVVLSCLVGGILGALAGYFRGWVDGVIMRIVDLFFAFPAIVLAMVITAVLGPSLTNAVLAVAIVSWPTYARVVRGLVLSTAEAPYVQAARLLGSSPTRALVKEVLPNVFGPVIVLATLDVGQATLLLAGLSFLGLGAQPPTPEWGAMVATGTQYFESWWMSTFPGLAIFTVVLGCNFLGDSLRDALDPRSSRDRRGDAS